MANNYTLGRGEIHFSRFKPGTQIPEGYRYIGNTPEVNLTIEEEKLDHFSSDRGIREKDDAISLEVNRSGSLITDNIAPENIALFFFGEATVIATTGSTVTDELVEGVVPGLGYQLGQTEQNPVGARGLDMTSGNAPVVKDAGVGATTFDEGDDYTVDADTGMLTIVEGGAITAGTDLEVTYKTLTSTQTQVISGSSSVEGSMRYIAHNPKGEQFDYTFPWVTISPNGDFALKGDEWQQIPLNIEILKPTNKEAIYVNGRPFTV